MTRLEFLTNPYVNGLLRVLLPIVQSDQAPPHTLQYSDEEEPKVLAKIRHLIAQWAADEHVDNEKERQVLELALFPWASDRGAA